MNKKSVIRFWFWLWVLTTRALTTWEVDVPGEENGRWLAVVVVQLVDHESRKMRSGDREREKVRRMLCVVVELLPFSQ